MSLRNLGPITPVKRAFQVYKIARPVPDERNVYMSAFDPHQRGRVRWEFNTYGLSNKYRDGGETAFYIHGDMTVSPFDSTLGLMVSTNRKELIEDYQSWARNAILTCRIPVGANIRWKLNYLDERTNVLTTDQLIVLSARKIGV